MGFCHEDTGPLVGIESRGESFRLFNLADTEHIFAFENGNVEITYEFLAAFLTRLQEPEIRKALLKGDGSPAEGEREMIPKADAWKYCVTCAVRAGRFVQGPDRAPTDEGAER